MNGIDNAGKLGILKGRRLGLITNPSGVDRKLHSTAAILRGLYDLRAVYGPEHGIRGDQQAGLKVEPPAIDPELGVRNYSLHNKTLRPTAEMLDGIDMMVYDIQDVGARFYTYLYTLSYAMEECASRGISVTVLDRVNPLGGLKTEGELLREQWKGFVGMYPMPTRYALTIGEYAQYINKAFGIGCDLHIVPCEGWRRGMWFDQTGMQWIMPSPNIPTLDSAIVYIGTCIFEATNASEGRGTTHPFEIIGAPYVDAPKLVAAMERHKLPGVIWRPAHFIPTFSKHAGELCHGLQIHVTDRDAFESYESGLWLFHEMRELFPDFTVSAHLPYLLGDDGLRLGQEDVPSLIERARKESAQFARETAEFRLY